MALDDRTIMLVRRKFGRDIETDNDVYGLIAEIRKISGEQLGLNTVKRLLGMIPGHGTPRTATKNIVARYLGFNTWDMLADSMRENDPMSRFGDEEGIVYASGISIGTIVSFNFGNGKDIVLEYIGERHFRVISVTNSKIIQNDVLCVSRFVELGKFLADKVIRNGICLGSYNSEHKIRNLRVSKSDSLSGN